MSTTTRSRTRTTECLPWRRTLGALAGFTSVSAAIGALQLVTGVFTPPVEDLEALGLHSWVLPGVWLGLSVGVPCAAVTWLALLRTPWVGVASVWAGLLLLVELGVQVPFVGLDPLQAVMGAVAASLLVLGTLSWREINRRLDQESGGPDEQPRGNDTP